MTMQTWSQTAATNATADTTINWREGQSPSSVNDSARAMMAAIAKHRDDISGILAGTGSASAYVVTSNQNIAGTLCDGFRVSFRTPAANANPVTLSVDGTAAKPLRVAPDAECLAGLLNAGGVYSAVYVAATQEWLLDGIFNPSGMVPTGVIDDFLLATAPAGWIMHAEGGSIGSGASAATVRANADTWNLFNGLWTSFPALALSPGGRGASAAADFAANKIMTLPSIAGRAFVCRDAAGTVLAGASALGATLGAQTHALTEAQNGRHAHNYTDPGHMHSYDKWHLSGASGFTGGSYYFGVSVANTSLVYSQILIQESGSGTPHNNVQPSFAVNKIIKL